MSTAEARLQLEPLWKAELFTEFKQAYMQELRAFLQARKQQGVLVYPSGKDIFAAFNYTPLDQVKVVILGQDPYHGPNQAHGLCFSVSKGVPLPPSLKNIYQELQTDLGIKPPKHGCLEAWARQGVFLLNSVLTVEHGQAGAHQGKGWERFTDAVIRVLNEKCESLVFLLWGSYAQKKAQFVDQQRHLVLKSVHPSPLSAHRGFLGCQHFSKTNHYLRRQSKQEIDWCIV